ncbi:MAG: long-chain fatty acid--CoA ligase [Gemmatimonadales bacterium]|nr:MAG: long-chain fatty acid--CoA ligase [Gemmatimonadales bacterium]
MALIPERAPHTSVHQVLDAAALEHPDRTYLLHADPTRDGARRVGIREVSFGTMARESRALAGAMAHLGIEAGDRVALVLPGRPEFVTALFALARLGAVAVPLNPRISPGELRYMLRHSEATALVTVERFQGEDYLQLFEEMLPVLPDLQYLFTVGDEDLWYDDRIYQFEDLVSAGEGRPVPEGTGAGDGDELLAILYTSGTTGKPKGVEVTHRNLLHSAAAVAEGLDLRTSDRIFGVTALFHVFGLGPGILATLLARASLVLQDEFEPEEALDLVERLGVTIHYGVPTLFAQELDALRMRSRDLSSLRLGMVAGAPMPEPLFDRVESEMGLELLSAYSLTETSSVLAMTRSGDSPEKRKFTVGRPVSGVELRVVEEGRRLPPESLGEIAARGDLVMRGYYRQPRETARVLGEDGFLLTGDLGILDEEGHVHLVGRRKGVIIRGGYNVYPREVEDRLHAHPAVHEAAVVGIRDEWLGEAIGAVIVPVEGAIITESELRDWCADVLADYKLPDRVTFEGALPMTPTGKVRRVDLERLFEAPDPDED